MRFFQYHLCQIATNAMLQDISQILPYPHQFKLLSITSEPKECNPIVKHHHRHSTFSNPTTSVKQKYFFLLIQNGVILFGIEIYKYISITANDSIQYIFISKVDTTGLVDIRVRVNKLITTILKYLIRNVPSHITIRLKTSKSSTIKRIDKLIHRPRANYKSIDVHTKTKVKLSLFTKSSNQYFFPESSKNVHKHNIDGDALLKWWINLIDNIDELPRKCLLIPGSLDGRSYLRSGWQMGSIFGKQEMAIYNIPNFPDDPKTRFLEFLIIENRWKVKLPAFYRELGFRQEFRLNNVVGIIGCELQWFTSTSNETDINSIQLTNRQYKKLIKLIKSENFNNIDDVRALVQVKLPRFLKLYNKFWDNACIAGKYIYTPTPSVHSLEPINNLTGLIRKKKKS